MPNGPAKMPAWTPTKVQFLYRHQNQRYYVRTFAAGKEKWTTLISVVSPLPPNRRQVVWPRRLIRFRVFRRR